MPKKSSTPERIVGLLRRAEVELAQGRTMGEVCRGLGVSNAAYYRWRAEYGGLKVDQLRRMKELSTLSELARGLGVDGTWGTGGRHAPDPPGCVVGRAVARAG
jgi:Transposase